MSLHCPKCNSVVYSRRHKFCGFCGAELPAEFSLTRAELAALAKEDAEAEKRRKARKEKDWEEEQEGREGGSSPPMMF